VTRREGVLLVEEWVNIRELARQGLSVSEIARRSERDRKTVHRVLVETAPAGRAKSSVARVTKLGPFEEHVKQRVERGCLNATVLMEEILRQGYTGKITMLRLFLAPLRQELLRKREATERFETGPGKQAQVDWGEFGKIWDSTTGRWHKLYVFIFTLGYSRAQYGEFTTCCDMEHFLHCHLGAFAALGVPQQILYDNLKTGILGRRPDGTPILPGRFLDFALYYGFTPKYCKPYRARTKGKVERGIGYVRQNFWVRVKSEVASGELELAALNERAKEWVEKIANVRVHGTHGEVVLKRFEEEKSLLGTVSARPAYDTDYHWLRKVSRDGRFSYRGKLYAVDLLHALGELDVAESLDGQITVRDKHGVVVRAQAGELTAPTTRGQEQSEATVSDQPGRGGLLTLIGRDEPVVQTRSLAEYEEVASAVRAG
jgi:transposase